MKRRALLTMLALATLLLALSPFAQAGAPGPAGPAPQVDAYEPDELDPPWIGDGEPQNRNFYPDGDADKARLRVKAGQWYEVRTYGLGPLVDTSLSVQVGGALYKDDDGGPEALASRVLFLAPDTAEAAITVINKQEVYGAEQTYKLYAGEAAPPTPTPTATPLPAATAAPTATPARPIVSFSATPEQTQRPGECVTLRWAVDRASEVFLVLPNGNQEGVEGHGERQVCPLETAEYQLKVNAPGGNETARVRVTVPLPTHTPTPSAARTAGPSEGGSATGAAGGRATLHVAVYVDENNSEAYDPDEGVLGATVLLMSQADPGEVESRQTDGAGQAHFPKTRAGSYTVLIPHLGYARAVSFRGEELAIEVRIPALRLPSRIP